MRIKKFSVGGYDFKVVYVKELYDQNGNSLAGTTDMGTGTVTINTVIDNSKVSNDYLAHTLCHELSHIIAILLGDDELNHNEQMIDLMGLFIFQFVKTKK